METPLRKTNRMDVQSRCDRIIGLYLLRVKKAETALAKMQAPKEPPDKVVAKELCDWVRRVHKSPADQHVNGMRKDFK